MEPSVALIEVQEGLKPNKANPNQASKPAATSIKTFDRKGCVSNQCILSLKSAFKILTGNRNLVEIMPNLWA